ncbi:14037_t:CDS:2 [Entrophospora sp. SA101]|nr:13211_t:CDS:2 [Entrophospora sp. SA101]CAJ0761760.1 14037_t:CDS:2 [Entrophospora sp. SA101]CAJ0830887.1 6229_t:CDS:2 [Entrophospora sp. SA101]
MAETKEKKNTPHLILLDIDGTSTNPDFATLNPRLKKVLQELITKKNHLVLAYNGAYIGHPAKKNEEIVINPISNQVVKGILNEPIIKKNLRNVLIDKTDRTTISTSDDIYYQEIFFNGNPYVKGNISKLLGDKGALQLVLEFPHDEETFNNILLVLRTEYGAAIDFYFGSKLKAKKSGDKVLVPDPKSIIIKIRSKFASKELIRTVGKGIAMADSVHYLKAYAHGITDYGILNKTRLKELKTKKELEDFTSEVVYFIEVYARNRDSKKNEANSANKREINREEHEKWMKKIDQEIQEIKEKGEKNRKEHEERRQKLDQDAAERKKNREESDKK